MVRDAVELAGAGERAEDGTDDVVALAKAVLSGQAAGSLIQITALL